MDLEDGMVDPLEEHVEPLGDHSTLPQQFLPHQSFIIQPEADSSRGKAKVSLIEIVEEDETAVEYESENKSKAGPSKESRFSPQTSPPMGEGAKQKYRNICRPLYQAALEGNWPVARRVIDEHPEAVHSRITMRQETPLHIAAAMEHESFVKELLVLMESKHLEIKDIDGNTAFLHAAASGNVKIARLMVDKNPNLPNIQLAYKATPLFIAARLGHRDMAWYLVDVTALESLKDDDFNKLLFTSIRSKLYDVALLAAERHGSVARARNENDETALHVLVREGSQQVFWWQRCISLFLDCLTDVALKIVKHRESMARARNEKGETTLHVLARKPSEFGKSQQVFWRRCIYFCLYHLRGIDSEYNSMHKKARELLLLHLWTKFQDYYDPIFREPVAVAELQHYQKKKLAELQSLLFLAIEFGNVEFVTVLIESYPDLVYRVDTKGRSIFHVAIACRQKEIFNVIYWFGALKDQIAYVEDKDNNNLLHLAGMLAPESHLSKISGAALQMQEELIWFKEVERLVMPSYREMKNRHQKSPRVLFTEKHKSLKRQGENWMKATANSCMLAATLIATVMFAAAFTVPGGNKDVDGTPHFLKAKSFMVFAISDAVSLFSSVTSILTFLSILTSRYAEIDFLISLPIRLILGLLTLFISIVTMIVAFSATFFIVLGHDLFAQVETLVYALACVPITLFAALKFRLFADVIYSTYKASFLLVLNQHRVKKHKWTRTSMPLKAK